MPVTFLEPCEYIFEVEIFQGAAAANGNLPPQTEDCVKRLFRELRTVGRQVEIEYLTDGVGIFEACGVFIHIKREVRFIAILRIEEI